MNRDVESRFLADTANHGIKILHDDGLYRHIRCENKDTNEAWNQWFDVVTYPNYIVFSGDMGEYIFSRVEDMFRFFRHDKLEINPGYWGEKLRAADRHNGYKEYDREVFEDAVKEYYNDHVADHKLKKKEKEELWGAITDNVLCAENEYEAHSMTRDFEHGDFEFTDFWEQDLMDYTHHYLWCLYAIVWTIQQYDAVKK